MGFNDAKLVASGLIAMSTLVACGRPAEDGEQAADDTITASDALRVRRPPRLLAPLSTSISTSRRPLFQWQPGGDRRATVQICRDRACRHLIADIDTADSSVRPAHALPAGVVFWRVTSRWPGRHADSSAVWQLTIPARDSGRAGSWGATPDFNGDGLSDLAVGAKLTAEMRIFPGRPGGPSATPAQTLSGPPGFGDEAGPAGDVDGDGFGDLAVWTSGPPQTVTVYRGGPNGLASPVTFAAPEADSFSQMRVLSAGDVNGDGYGDLLVGGRANAALHLGGPAGVQTTPVELLPNGGTDARWPIGGGDFDGDGFVDAVIAGVDAGRLYTGNGRRLIARPGVTITPPFFGALAGDFNGDGLADLAMGGAILAGGPTGLEPFQAIAGAFFYQGVGDVNGDGFSDALAMISSLFGVLEAERVYFGGTTPCTSTDCPTFVPLLVPGHLNDGNGQAAVLGGGLGDLNGDGYGDIAYISPGAGAVYLFFGSAGGPPQAPSRTIAAEQGFGFSLARL
jgi:hypothetical protein